MAKYTDEEKRQARQVDLLSYLESQNEIARNSGDVAPYRISPDGKQHRVHDFGGMLIVRNAWNQRSTGKGGNTMDFVMEIEGLTFNEAMNRLLNREEHRELHKVDLKERYVKPDVPFELPERNETFKRVIAYLNKTRGIDVDVILSEIRNGNIYEDKEHHNVVFVGRNPDGDPVWAQKRTTLSNQRIVLDQKGSDARYTYYLGPENPKIVVTVESPIEAQSLVSLLKINNRPYEQFGFLSLGGVHSTALDQFLKDHPDCKYIITALNNDRAEKPNEIKGREGAELIKQKYHGRSGYYVTSIFPHLNDFNDELKQARELERERKEAEQQASPPKEKTVEDQIKDYRKSKQQMRKVISASSKEVIKGR